MRKEKYEHDGIAVTLKPVINKDFYKPKFTVTFAEVTLKGDKDSDLRITYSTSYSESSDHRQEWVHGICTIEKVDKKKTLGLFERKQQLFQSRCDIDYGVYHPGGEIGESYSAIKKLDRKRLEEMSQHGKIVFPQGLEKMDENLAKIEKLAQEVVAFYIERRTQEYEREQQLKKQKTVPNAEKVAAEEQKTDVIHSLANRYLQEDYQTAVTRLTAKLMPEKTQTADTKPSNNNSLSNSDISVRKDSQYQ